MIELKATMSLPQVIMNAPRKHICGWIELGIKSFTTIQNTNSSRGQYTICNLMNHRIIGSITFPLRPTGLHLLSCSSFFENLMFKVTPHVQIIKVKINSKIVVQNLTGCSTSDFSAVLQQESAMTIFMLHYFSNNHTRKARKSYST